MKFSLLILVLLFSQLGMAHGGHDHSNQPPVEEADICSVKNPEICAHVHFAKKVNSTTASEFILHIEDSLNQKISDLKVVLWMDLGEGEGHGSDPVEITPMKGNKFKVKNAWFVMTGTWLVQVSFVMGAESHQISIPVVVEQ